MLFRSPLTIGTRGMGMYVRVPLTKQPVEVSAQHPELYRFRPDQVNAANLTQAFSVNVRDVADPDTKPAKPEAAKIEAAPPKGTPLRVRKD